MKCPCGVNLDADDVSSVEGMCTCCASEEARRLRGSLAVALASAERWKQIATEMRAERDKARLLLEKVGQMMGAMG